MNQNRTNVIKFESREEFEKRKAAEVVKRERKEAEKRLLKYADSLDW